VWIPVVSNPTTYLTPNVYPSQLVLLPIAETCCSLIELARYRDKAPNLETSPLAATVRLRSVDVADARHANAKWPKRRSVGAATHLLGRSRGLRHW
jgi:hypothetical protein